MAVDTLHSSYSKYQTDWSFVRDCLEGDKAIKAGKTRYIPQLSGQSSEEYAAYIGRPYFEGYTQRVHNGTTGLLFAKSPQVEAPTQLKNLFDNFDLNGSTLTDYAQDVSGEVMLVDRVGCLVDMGRDENQNRPYATIYKTENILNWRYQNINNQNTLTMVVLQEVEQQWISDFEVDDVTIYRVLFLIDGRYEQHVYRPNKDSQGKTDGYNVEVIVPLMNGRPLSYIPFVSITSEKLTIEPSKPPLLDLARVNLAHFKLNVDYYHGLHFTALPTAWITGYQKKQGDDSLNIGSTTVLEFPRPETKLGYLEFEGKGLETLENEKAKLVDAMVVLGSNMLQGDKKTAEAEATVAMRSAGQNASLISTADTISRGITKVLEIMAEWMGVSVEVSYKLNTDYNLTQMSPQLLKEIIVGKTLGEIPRKVVFETLKAGEIIKEDVTFEDYETMLQEEAPVIADSALPPANNNEDVDLQAIRQAVGAEQ